MKTKIRVDRDLISIKTFLKIDTRDNVNKEKVGGDFWNYHEEFLCTLGSL